MTRYTIIPTIAMMVLGCGSNEQGMFMQEDFEVYSANQFPGQSSWSLVKTGAGLADQQVISQAAKAGVKCMQLKGDANKDAVMERTLADLDEDFTVEGWLQATDGSTGGILLSGSTGAESTGELFVGFDENGEIMLRSGNTVLVRVDLGGHKHFWTYVKVKVHMLEGAMSVDLSVGNEVVREGIQVSPMNLDKLALQASGTSTVLFDDVVAWSNPTL